MPQILWFLYGFIVIEVFILYSLGNDTCVMMLGSLTYFCYTETDKLLTYVSLLSSDHSDTWVLISVAVMVTCF